MSFKVKLLLFFIFCTNLISCQTDLPEPKWVMLDYSNVNLNDFYLSNSSYDTFKKALHQKLSDKNVLITSDPYYANYTIKIEKLKGEQNVYKTLNDDSTYSYQYETRMSANFNIKKNTVLIKSAYTKTKRSFVSGASKRLSHKIVKTCISHIIEEENY